MLFETPYRQLLPFSPFDSNLENANAIVAATSGTGKSVHVGKMLLTCARQDVQVDTTYSMTLFKLNAAYSMTVGGNRLITNWGRCESKINVAATAVEVRCMQMGKGPTCATVFLEDPRDGSRNRPNATCNPNYSPYVDRPIPDAVSHSRLVLPFRDPAGQVKYAVDESKMDGAQIVIRVYEPADHFTRAVISPSIMLKDLAVH